MVDRPVLGDARHVIRRSDDSFLASAARLPGRRGEATRSRLLEATRAVLNTTPHRNIAVVDIAREAGTSAATFYQYFADVEAAILVLAEDMVEQGAPLSGIVTGATWSPLDAWETGLALVDALLAFGEENGAVLRVVDLLTDEGDGRFRERRPRVLDDLTIALAAVTEASVNGGRLPAGTDPRATAGILVSMLAHVVVHQHRLDRSGIRAEDVRVSLTRHVVWGVTGIDGSP